MASEPLAYLNGRWIPRSRLRLAAGDAGFVFGATASDLCRTFRGRLFRLADHVTRFRRSCTLARIPQPVPDDELAGAAEELVGQNARVLPGELVLVIFATPGPIGYYAGRPGGLGEGPPTLGMHTFPLPFERYAPLFREGARLRVPEIRPVPRVCVDPRAKQRSRLHWWLAHQEVSEKEPGASALLLDAGGRVTETASANLLVAKNGVVYTPERDAVLPGISLRVTEELCRGEGIPFEERTLGLDDCLSADEAMLSSTPFCLAGVRRIEGAALRWPGPLYQRLQAAWDRYVGLDVAAQFCRKC